MAATDDPWRYGLPCGHVCYVGRAKGGYRCDTCGETHDHLVDRKTGELISRRSY